MDWKTRIKGVDNPKKNEDHCPWYAKTNEYGKNSQKYLPGNIRDIFKRDFLTECQKSLAKWAIVHTIYWVPLISW